ncbi:hypothetical protein RV13_GL001019 [Enterococcus raffinosus]|nr:hypothetical protein [Enterococcus sp. HMSC14A10]OJG85443.1 hypothetical protein RV13_GL001019 [Enterococcus raffinosus]
MLKKPNPLLDSANFYYRFLKYTHPLAASATIPKTTKIGCSPSPVFG